MEDKGQQILKDVNDGQYEGYCIYYKWDNGLCLCDWCYVVCIVNIDISDLFDFVVVVNIVKFMVKVLYCIFNCGMGCLVFYMNCIVVQVFDL